jgi:PAS domain S-box-containing protein
VRDEIRKQTLLAASAVNRRRVRSLTGTEPDLNHPDYLRLREQLMQIGGTNPHFRTAYLMLLREGKIIIEVDSVPEGASGHGDPGEVRKPLPKEIFSVFTTGRGTIVGPYTDETGTFISGFEAIRDFSTNQIVGALGIDLAAGVWKVSIAGSRLVPICITMLLAFIIIGFFMARQQLWESAQTISASEKRLTSAQRIAHIGSWTLDTRTNQVTWSEEMDRIFRRVLRAEELVYSDILIFIHPEDREKLAETMQRAISEGVGFELELRIIRADGSVGYGISKAEVKLGGGAEVIQVVGTMEDITERRLAESALRESEEQFRAMSAAAQDAVIMMDNDGLITFWSEAAERIFGRSRNETVGKSTHDLLAPAVYREEFQKVFPQ